MVSNRGSNTAARGANGSGKRPRRLLRTPELVSNGGWGSGRKTTDGHDLGLFTDGGPFEFFPGAIAVVGCNARVLTWNPPARAIVDLIEHGGSAELKMAITTALEGRPAQITPFQASAGKPGGPIYDLSVLPWVRAVAAFVFGRDITLEQSRNDAQQALLDRGQGLLQQGFDLFWETDVEGRLVFAAPDSFLGWSVPGLLRRSADVLLPPSADPAQSPFAQRSPQRDVEIDARRSDGSMARLRVNSEPLFDAAGAWCGTRGAFRDVTRESGLETVLADHDRLAAEHGYLERLLASPDRSQAPARTALDALLSARSLDGAGVFHWSGERLGELLAVGGDLPKRRLPALLRRLLDGEESAASSAASGGLCAVPLGGRDGISGLLCAWRKSGPAAWPRGEVQLLHRVARDLGPLLPTGSKRRS